MKKCCRCKEIKPETDFYKNAKRCDGLQTICKECDKDRKRVRVQTDQRRADDRVRNKKRTQLPEHRKYMKEYCAIYNATPEAKLVRENYRKSEHGKRVTLACKRRRRARENNLNENFTADMADFTIASFNKTCFNCGKEFRDIDHNMPLSKGFCLDIWNAVCLCRHCNASKLNLDPVDFYGQERSNELFDILFVLECEWKIHIANVKGITDESYYDLGVEQNSSPL